MLLKAVFYMLSCKKKKSGNLTYCVFQREEVTDEYCRHDPDHKHIYRFVRTLFSAAQLTAECAIVTLVSTEVERQKEYCTTAMRYMYVNVCVCVCVYK